ncbi:lipase 3-like isoform X2 [Macrosteles quadrilineatus]|nr:lipase 3-like isoform X2 [Macrosteles quadrilineatus]
MQMAVEAGINATRHEVRTEDGYWLTLHRVGTSRGTPILLLHGLLGSSDQWLLLTRQQSLPMLLTDAGYDVWLGNLRGNVYSRRHDILSPDIDYQFWNFSLHEMSYYDLPAMLDHITASTGHSRVFYCGYSIGGTLFLMMAASRPQYNTRVQAAYLLAPLVVRPGALLGGPAVYRMAFEFLYAFVRLLKDYQVGEFYPRQAEMLKVKEEACAPTAQTFPLCVRILQKPFGLMSSEYDITKLVEFLKSFGSGTSTKVIEHTIQLVQTGRFQQFDHGHLDNLAVYGATKPPEYDLTRVSTPTVIHYDKNDILIDYKAVDLAAKKLPCLVCNCLSNREGFSHFGYVISRYAATFVYKKMIKSMRLLEDKRVRLRSLSSKCYKS